MRRPSRGRGWRLQSGAAVAREPAPSPSEGNAGVALKPEIRISGGERPRKHENKIKQQGIF